MSLEPRLRFAGRLPKLGNAADECEDHSAVSLSRFAVADGVSDAIYSQVWARILTASYCNAPLADESPSVDSWLAGCRGQWREWEAEASARALPWFTRDKLQAGSFATFAGLSFQPGLPPDGEHDRWVASACGDACLFVVRDDRLSLAFPIDAEDAFDSHPSLLSTEPGHSDPDRSMRVITGAAEPGDRFYLVTDALAQWFLRSHARGGLPWAALNRVSTDEEFAVMIGAFRDAGDLRNDDVTLVAVETT